VPPAEEQKAIVDFIERETAVINQFLTNKRRLIALLEEQKQVVINTAVTQGLDPTAPRKLSGIDWLGDIPANWQGIKLKHLSKFIQTGPFGSQLHAHDYIDNGMPVINPIHLQNGRIVPDWGITVDNETLTRLERHQLEIGDVILARRGELGRCAVVDSESAGWLCGTGSMNLRPKSDQVFSPYLAQIIQSEKVKTWLTTESVGSTMDNLNGSILGNLKVPVPPIQEQQQIIYLCREREAEINAAIERTQREIELIEEYRTTLIAQAVTGKIDVRSGALHPLGCVAPLPPHCTTPTFPIASPGKSS
jgi:type I restriction enzyme S subunit